jgi:phosphate:Na+ symporter
MTTFIGLTGAIALLLWGLRMVRTGVMRAYGTPLKRLAASAEGRIVPAFLSGMFVAALLQSGTATALIAASFAGQGIVGTSTAFLTILGADVGTAIAVLVASQKLTAVSPILIAIGVFGFLSTEDSKKRALFRAFSGLGMILLALSMIGQIAADLAQQREFATIIRIITTQPLLLVFFAVGLTYLAHSSLAMVLLAAGFVANGLIDLPSGLFWVLGANIGSGMLPVIATWNAKRAARAPVTASLLIRTACAVAMMLFVHLIAETYGTALPAAQFLVLFHLGLNIIVALTGLALSPILLRISMSVLPEGAGDEAMVEPKYLDEEAFDSPATALACAKREALHMADIVQTMLRSSLTVLRDNDRDLRREVVEMDDSVDLLFNAIKLYIARVLREELDEDESQRAMDLLAFTANMEHIGDIVDGNLMQLAGKKIDVQMQFSDDGLAEIAAMHEAVCANFDLAINTFVSEDFDLAHLLHGAKADVRKMERQSVANHLERIGTGLPNTIGTSTFHLDVLRDLKRINSHLTAIAYPVLKASGEVRKTKWKRKRQAAV